MPDFYHDLITQKSFKLLQKIKQDFDFVLIGGWAVFLYTKALKSKDIDIIVDYNQLSELRKRFNVFKNERLKKYEAKSESTDIDIYLPHYSELGIPIQEIIARTRSIGGFTVPAPEILLILKLYAFSSRRGSNKGKKDMVDIFSILSEQIIDWADFKKIIQKNNLQELSEQLKDLISSQKSIPELDLTNHKIAKLKQEILKNF